MRAPCYLQFTDHIIYNKQCFNIQLIDVFFNLGLLLLVKHYREKAILCLKTLLKPIVEPFTIVHHHKDRDSGARILLIQTARQLVLVYSTN